MLLVDAKEFGNRHNKQTKTSQRLNSCQTEMDSASQLVHWAAIVAVLGWSYVAWARLWPIVFDRQAIKNATHEAAGYRIGWMIYWRLPIRPALLLTMVFLIPLVSTPFVQNQPNLWLLASVTVIALALWLFSPPGMRLALRETSLPDGKIVFEQQASRKLSRSIAVFINLGLIPALVMGTGLNWIWARFITWN